MKLTQKDLIAMYSLLLEDIEDVNFENAMDGFKKYISTIHSLINIGKIEMKYEIPINIYTQISKKDKILIFEDKIGNDSFKEKFNYFEKEIVFTVYSYNDKFTQEEKEDISLILSIMYNHFTRICDTKFIKNSNKYDNITGSYNLFGIISKYSKMQIDLKNFSCAFMNITGFKDITRQYGLRTGNKIFKSFYEAAMPFFEKDEVFGRLGGDNFLIFIKKTRLDDMIEMFNKLTVSFVFKGNNYSIHLNCRFGIYNVKKSEEDFMQVINKANIANVTCKSLKESNIFYYSDDFEAKISIEQQVLRSFQNGIDNEEFLVYYQPKVDVKTKTLCGAEALVRWKKDSNFISPVNFTPILERENLISILDIYMFEHTCKDIRNMLDKKIEPVKISVNFSRNNLKDKRIFNKIIDIMKKYDISSKYIEIEITESSMYEDSEVLKKLINKLKDKHISVSVDDFGTGYSSLNFIKDLPFDTIKIDKSFIDSIERNDEKSLLFLKNIITLIKGLKMKIVAEGVETQQQYEYLSSIDCDIIQGFYFDKPLSKKDFIKRIKNKQY